MKTDNMRIWEALGKTDPAHTKQFTRSGGFKGTAIKPMWANKQMTEFFGPCGIGWGPDKPQYDVVDAGGETLVYCTVGLWYMDGGTKRQVYGVGGDKVLSQVLLKDERGGKIFDTEAGRYKTYPQTDDEAYKKAYTDALSNAMKFIGVAADVHMGMFDDNKYVQQVRGEFEADKQAEIAEEVERQKKNPAKVEPIGPNQTLTNQLTESNKIFDKADAEKKVAAMRAELSEKLGIFSIEGDVLHCKIIGIEKLKKKSGEEYLSVTLNQRHPNGSQKASVWDTKLWQVIDKCLDHECKLKISVKGLYITVEDVLWFEGIPESITNDDLPSEMFK